MRAILSDVNIEGQVSALYSVLLSPKWQELWEVLGLPNLRFDDIGLHTQTPDVTVWRLCQREQYLLMTANRNQDGPDSLEATLRAENTPSSLPVFTLANSKRVLKSYEYADRVAERLIESLIDMENLRGTGRVYLP